MGHILDLILGFSTQAHIFVTVRRLKIERAIFLNIIISWSCIDLFYFRKENTKKISLIPGIENMWNSSKYLIGAALLCLMATAVSGTDHIVGANRGWNPGINYTIWARNHTFYVGDFISFRYQKFTYNVFQVDESGYDNCTIQGATGNWSSGKDFILLTEAKRYYFICGTGGCSNGMKVSVVVHPLPSPPASAHSAEHSTESTAPRQRGSVIAAVVMAVLGSILVQI